MSGDSFIKSLEVELSLAPRIAVVGRGGSGLLRECMALFTYASPRRAPPCAAAVGVDWMRGEKPCGGEKAYQKLPITSDTALTSYGPWRSLVGGSMLF